MRFLILSIIVTLSACSSGEPALPVEITDQTPSAVVEEWLDAVADVDAERLGAIVEPIGLAVIAGVENQLASAELVVLLEGGFDGDPARSYWRTFRDDFGSIRGVPIASLVVGGETPVAGEPGFTAVEVSSPDSQGRVIVRRDERGAWRVDMVATVGSALVGPLGTYLLSVLDGADGIAIGDAYKAGIIPALDAAIVLAPENSDLVFETEFIRQLLAP